MTTNPAIEHLLTEALALIDPEATKTPEDACSLYEARTLIAQARTEAAEVVPKAARRQGGGK